MKGKVYRPGEVMFHNFIVYGRNKGGNKARSAAVDGGVIVFRDFEGKREYAACLFGFIFCNAGMLGFGAWRHESLRVVK